MAIGVNWKEIWGPVWKAVWTTIPPAEAVSLEYLLLISHITQSMSKTSKITMEVDLISRIQQQLDGSSSI